MEWIHGHAHGDHAEGFSDLLYGVEQARLISATDLCSNLRDLHLVCRSDPAQQNPLDFHMSDNEKKESSHGA